MSVWVKPGPHRHTKPHFLQMGLLLIPITYRCHLRVLCPVRRPMTTLDCVLLKDSNCAPCSQITSREQFSSLPLCAARTTPHFQMLVFHRVFNLSSYVLPRDPQKRLWSHKLLNRTVPCELVCDFISSHSGMPRDPVQPHSVLGRVVVQCLPALSYQGRCGFGSLKCFQSCLTIRANANKFLWPVLSFSLMNRG